MPGAIEMRKGGLKREASTALMVMKATNGILQVQRLHSGPDFLERQSVSQERVRSRIGQCVRNESLPEQRGSIEHLSFGSLPHE